MQVVVAVVLTVVMLQEEAIALGVVVTEVVVLTKA
jgi:hypothetical protein